MAPSLRHRRPRGAAGPRPRAGRLPRCARVARGAARERPRRQAAREARGAAARLRPGERALSLAGSRARTPRCSSTHERVQLFTDFRYAESARAVEGAEFVDAKRDLFQTLSELLSGRIGFEATSLTFERYSRLHAGGVEPVPDVRARRGAARRQGRGRAGRDPARCGHREHRVRALRRRRRLVGRTERELAWRMEQFLHDANADGVSFPVHRRVGPERGQAAHRFPASGASSKGETVIVDAGCMVDGYCSDCTRTLRDRAASGRADARIRGLSRCAARGARGRSARGVRAGRRRGGARPDRGGRLRRGVRARARPRRRPARARGPAPRAGVAEHARERATS